MSLEKTISISSHFLKKNAKVRNEWQLLNILNLNGSNDPRYR